MKITNEWLAKNNACIAGREWFDGQKKKAVDDVVNQLIVEDRFNWASWLICRVMDRREKIQYAVFAAEQVIDIFEKKAPDDKRPRLAIDAAKSVLKKDTPENREAAKAAAVAAREAAEAAAGEAAEAAAWTAAGAAREAAGAAWTDMQTRIINYGLLLLAGKE
jgi:hypothetical protein